MSDDDYEAYSKLHCCCPRCGSDDICTTCVGIFGLDLATMVDRNIIDCCVCRWHGYGHEMVPRTEETSEGE